MFVCSGRLVKGPRLLGFNKKKLFLTVLEAGESKIKVLAHLVSGESCRWLLLGVFSHVRERERGLCFLLL